MVKVGIDTLAIYTPRYALDLATLAQARGIDPNKYLLGLGQHAMSIPPPGEDIVTMAVNAAERVCQEIDKQQIGMLLFATESGIDQSKAAGLYVHELLGLSSHCRVVELKQACYSATAAIQLALPYLREHTDKKILVIASDIARYGLETAGESSQGAGAIALVLSSNPRIIAIESEYGIFAENVMDFWRPNYRHEALVDGKYSSKLYLTMLEKSFMHYKTLSKRQFQDHAYFCYHTPVPRLVEKAHQHLIKLQNSSPESKGELELQASLQYARQIGNTYTASLYISLVSLLDHLKQDMANQRVGFYSYGSGCVAEYFSGIIQQDYKKTLLTSYHQNLLSAREYISYETYERFYQFKYAEDGHEQCIPSYKVGSASLVKIDQHKRFYAYQSDRKPVERPSKGSSVYHAGEKLNGNELSKVKAESPLIKEIRTPGKLILSGEHAVVYGGPALAMAINRYTKATVTHETSSQIKFDLANLSHHSHLSFQALKFLKDKIKSKYHRFICGDYSIREVLQKTI